MSIKSELAAQLKKPLSAKRVTTRDIVTTALGDTNSSDFSRVLTRLAHTAKRYYEHYQEVDYVDFTSINTPVAERKKLDVGDIFINQVKCTLCGWYIRSKNRHDMRSCKCGAISIDGGSWYVKVVGNLEAVEYHTVYYKEAYGHV